MRYEACAVYILANLNRSVLYVGVTSDLLKRIPEHRARLNPRSFTSRYRVDRLVHFEPFQDIVAAIEREKQLKSWTRAKKLALVEKGNREWRDLWPEFVA
jgi:putative endonuclease